LLNNEIYVGDKLVGVDSSPFVIAEIGSNFDQNFDKALRLIEVAAEAKADAVKFQLFKADALYPNRDGLYDVFKSIELDAAWVPDLKEYSESRDLHFMASAFDLSSVQVLEEADVVAHKIASSEATNLPLLHSVASTGKPIFLSTGMCDMVDVEDAISLCAAVGNTKIALLQCGAMYPLPADLVNLNILKTFSYRFGCPVGFSDHTLRSVAATVAVGMGARIFEKHFTLDKKDEGPDHFYALEPEELKSYVKAIHEAYLTLGSREKEMLPKEREVGRREGLYASRDLAQGEEISAGDFYVGRPALGLSPRYSSAVIGSTLVTGLAKDEPITWRSLKFRVRK